MQTILIVDDDPHIRQVLRFALEKQGYRVCEADNGQQALQTFADHEPHLVVLDILMPEMDGIEVCRKLRGNSSVPILMLSSKDDEIDRIVGLELGADDYVTKPFSPRELVARVKAVLRRTGDAGGGEERSADGQRAPMAGRPVVTGNDGQHEESMAAHGVLAYGKLHMDTEGFSVHWDGVEVTLTATEFKLLRTLLRRPGKVYSRDALIDDAYGYNIQISDRTVDSHLRRIRQKFAEAGGNPIETVHGLGYKLTPCR